MNEFVELTIQRLILEIEAIQELKQKAHDDLDVKKFQHYKWRLEEKEAVLKKAKEQQYEPPHS